MKNAVIGALIGALAIGGALGAFAATRTVETTVGVDARVWQRVSDGELYVSVRPEDGGQDAWVTSTALDMTGLDRTGRFHLSPLVTIDVPVTVDVEVADTSGVAPATPDPGLEGEEARPTVAGPCCEVAGMPGSTAIREQLVADMQDVIDFALEEYGITHSGTITLNIAFSDNGLLQRYEDAFGEELEELPDECSFQRGEHMFFTAGCRANEIALATEWIERAMGTADVTPSWIGHGAFDYFVSHYTEGTVPEWREDRFRRVLFYERGIDIRRDDASDDMMTLAMLYTIGEYGDFSDWLRLYGGTQAGLDSDVAFQSVFGRSLEEFYADFEKWAEQQKHVLISVALPSCKAASEHLTRQPGSIGLGFGYPDYRVPLEIDDDGDGIVCEGFIVPLENLP